MKQIQAVPLFVLVLILLLVSSCTSQSAPTSEANPVFATSMSVTSSPPGEIILYRGNAQRTGIYNFPGIRQQPEVLWQVRVEPSLLTPPLFTDDMLYVGSSGGKLHALNAETGEKVWSTDGFGQLEATGAIAGDLIISGGYSKLVRALDRASGEERWTFTTANMMQGAPLIVDDRVYIATYSAVYALELPSGQKIWEATTGSEDAFMGAPAYEDGVIYTTGGKLLLALNSQTGRELWRVEKEEQFLSLAVANGLVYVGNGDHHFYAFDRSTGEERWQYEAGDEIWSAPAVDGGTVYAGNSDQMLYALNAQTGKLIWSFDTGGKLVSGPLVSGGVLYVSDSNHELRSGPRHLYTLDANTGQQLWMFETISTFLPAPELADNMLYVISSGEVIALKAPRP